MSNYVSKAQELATLEKIEQLVNELGEGSYLSETFQGIFDEARQNIENDWGCGFSDYKEAYERYSKQAEEYRKKYESAKSTIIMLCNQIEEVIK